jgi:hypothetical protein
MKRAVERRYGLDRNPGEIDHRVPLALGGAGVLRNLWPEPGGRWSYHAKDRMESVAWRDVCRRGTLSLRAAQALFLAPDWRVGYKQLLGQ